MIRRPTGLEIEALLVGAVMLLTFAVWVFGSKKLGRVQRHLTKRMELLSYVSVSTLPTIEIAI